MCGENDLKKKRKGRREGGDKKVGDGRTRRGNEQRNEEDGRENDEGRGKSRLKKEKKKTGCVGKEERD